jgi:thiopeptide-type bacteriocin biosynthesis protein
MTPDDWISAHIFHAGDLDQLITQVAAPLISDLAPERFFFLRYWEGGPHLRLRLRARAPGWTEHAERELLRRTSDYLESHRSSRTVTPAQYARAAALQARDERLANHDSTLHPNDSVRFIGYQPEHHAYGNSACMTAVEEHFTESSRVALALLANRFQPGQRAMTALTALTITLAACRLDLTRLAVRLPPVPNKIYREQRDDLQRQARQLWTASSDCWPAAWSRSIRTLRHALAHAACTPVDPGSPLSFLADAVPPAGRPLAGVLLRCTHLLNNRIGLTAATERHVALLTAQILSDLACKGEIA